MLVTWTAESADAAQELPFACSVLPCLTEGKTECHSLEISAIGQPHK